jgi:Kdo2-lipid A phosphotransferase
MSTVPHISANDKKWNFKALFICHIVMAILISTFLWPATRVYWDNLDAAWFKSINGSLNWGRNWQIFWALANHKGADWIEDIVILTFFTIHIKKAVKQLRPRKAAELLFCIFYIALIIYFVNRMLFRKHLQIPRESPTLVFDSSIRLSELIPWLKIKDDSPKCFPGDHATTAILFAVSYLYYAGWRTGIFLALYAAFLCMPRMITGAHWLSDVIIGSGSIVLFFLSWALCTPFHSWFINQFERFIVFIGSLKKRLRPNTE